MGRARKREKRMRGNRRVSDRMASGGSPPSGTTGRERCRWLSLPLALWMVLTPTAGVFAAEKLDAPLEREFFLDAPVEQAWKAILETSSSSTAVVNAIDAASHLLSLTFPVGGDQVDGVILDGDPLGPEARVAHALLWLRSDAAGRSRLFVRVALESAGILSHSNGQLERAIVEAVRRGGGFNEGIPVERRMQWPIEAVWTQLERLLETSPAITSRRREPSCHLLTFTVQIKSNALGKYSSSPVRGYHAGVLSLTAWLLPDGDETRLRIQSILLEEGSFSPPNLRSNGRFEAMLLKGLEERLRRPGDGSPEMADGGEQLAMEDDFHPKDRSPTEVEFINLVFSRRPENLLEIGDSTQVRHFPASKEEVWEAVQEVFGQYAVLVDACLEKGFVRYATSHATGTKDRFTIHTISALMARTEFGTRVWVASEDKSESAEEGRLEDRDLLNKIATQLFLRSRLDWLITGGGEEGAKE